MSKKQNITLSSTLWNNFYLIISLASRGLGHGNLLLEILIHLVLLLGSSIDSCSLPRCSHAVSFHVQVHCAQPVGFLPCVSYEIPVGQLAKVFRSLVNCTPIANSQCFSVRLQLGGFASYLPFTHSCLPPLSTSVCSQGWNTVICLWVCGELRSSFLWVTIGAGKVAAWVCEVVMDHTNVWLQAHSVLIFASLICFKCKQRKHLHLTWYQLFAICCTAELRLRQEKAVKNVCCIAHVLARDIPIDAKSRVTNR